MALTVLYPEALYPDDSVERAIYGAEVRVLFAGVNAIAELSATACAEADGLMTLHLAIPGEQIARFPRLRAIVRMGVGYDRIDRKAAAARNVTVCNVPDYGTTEVADHAMALLLAVSRGIAHLDREVREGLWQVPKSGIHRLAGRRLALLGVGRIGRRVAQRARAFGLEVTGYDPYLDPWDLPGVGRAESLGEALGEADFVSLHRRLTEATRNLIGAARLLREDYQEFQSIPLALAAYNAGSGAVRRWGGVPPYAETQWYVWAVLWVRGTLTTSG